jgi:hypothetical protein
MHGAAMYDGVMPDGHIIADGSPAFLKSAMDAGAILHIHLVPDLNIIHIAADNGIEPKTAIVSAYNIAYNGGVGGNETIITELRMFIFYGQYDGHEGSL